MKNADETFVASPAYDDDGNMTAYKDKSCTWNAENRLVAVETADKKVDFLYDYMGRRVKKQVYAGSPGSWSLESEKQFVYDGWNLVQEIAVSGGTSDKYFVWGPDLSGSLQGAGGIGGLVCSVDDGTAYYLLYDGNGNVGQVVDEGGGEIAAHYEYDAFGNTVKADGAYAEGNGFRFSTKYFDGETGFYYYGFRYYLSELGRWGSRDPLGERGGLNLNIFVFNNSINLIDLYGLNVIENNVKKISNILNRGINGVVDIAGWKDPSLAQQFEGTVKSRTKIYENIGKFVTHYDEEEQIPIAIGVNFGGVMVRHILKTGSATAITFFPDSCEIAFYSVSAGLGRAAIGGRSVEANDFLNSKFDPGGYLFGLSVGLELATFYGNHEPGSANSYNFQGNFAAAHNPSPFAPYLGFGDVGNWAGTTVDFLLFDNPFAGGGAIIEWDYKYMSGSYEVPTVIKLRDIAPCICNILRNSIKAMRLDKVQNIIESILK